MVKVITQQTHTNNILEQLRTFKKQWEQEYGLMSDYGSITTQEYQEGLFRIRSSGQGQKILLGLLLADRSSVINRTRQIRRQFLGFIDGDVLAVGNHHEECPFCIEEMNVPREDGTTEKGVRLVYCCSRTFGIVYLLNWFKYAVVGDNGQPEKRDTCPNCREKVSEIVRGRIIEEAEGDSEEDDDGEEKV
jgi:hypothetical protein